MKNGSIGLYYLKNKVRRLSRMDLRGFFIISPLLSDLGVLVGDLGCLNTNYRFVHILALPTLGGFSLFPTHLEGACHSFF